MMFLCSTNHHTSAVLTDNGSFSYHNGHVIDGELDQEIVTENQLVEDNSINIDNCCNISLCTNDVSAISSECLTAKKAIQNGVNLDIPTVNSGIDSSLAASTNSNSNLNLKENILQSVIDDETSKTDDNINGNLNHQTCISQNTLRENDIALVRTKILVKNKTQIISSASIGVVNVLYYKILAIITMCCINGFLLLPIILYYTLPSGNDNAMDTEYLHGKNTSHAKVCYKLRIDIHINTHIASYIFTI